MNTSHLLHSYGYLAIGLLVGIESLGVPLPGETILVAGALYAGATHKLSVYLIFVVATAAAIIGDNIGFWIGDKGGYRLVRRYGHRVRFDEVKLKVGRLVFDRHGGKVVFFGRFVSVLRTYAAFLAGTMRMPWHRFLMFNAAGGIVWAAVYSFVPYAVGSAINRTSHVVTIVFGVLAAVVIVAAIILVRRKAGQLEHEAQAAYPEPLPEH